MLFENYSKTILTTSFGVILSVMPGKCGDKCDYNFLNEDIRRLPQSEYQEKPDTWGMDMLILDEKLKPNTQNYIGLLADIAIQSQIKINSIATQTETTRLDYPQSEEMLQAKTTNTFDKLASLLNQSSAHSFLMVDAIIQTDELPTATVIETNAVSIQDPTTKRTYRKRDKNTLGQANLRDFGTRKRKFPEKLILTKRGKSYSTNTNDQLPIFTAQPITLELTRDQATHIQFPQISYKSWVKPGDYERKPSTRKK
ncbi:MAG: hypothetical protein V4544_05850 [Pseudomonadota bacterium]